MTSSLFITDHMNQTVIDIAIENIASVISGGSIYDGN